MKKRILVLLFVLSFEEGFSIDFSQLQILLEENSKQLELKKYDIDISKEDMNVISSENYPSITVGFNIEDSKSLNNDPATLKHT